MIRYKAKTTGHSSKTEAYKRHVWPKGTWTISGRVPRTTCGLETDINERPPLYTRVHYTFIDTHTHSFIHSFVQLTVLSSALFTVSSGPPFPFSSGRRLRAFIRLLLWRESWLLLMRRLVSSGTYSSRHGEKLSCSCCFSCFVIVYSNLIQWRIDIVSVALFCVSLFSWRNNISQFMKVLLRTIKALLKKKL